jgi:6-phosphofructokinase 1
VVQTIHEDCRTTNRWFVLIVMGRHAGHLALGAGRAAGASVSLIREEYPPGTIRLDDVVRVIEGAIVKGLADGDPSGVAVVAEGVAELIDPQDFEMLESVGLDEHGHIRLADLPFGKVLADAIKNTLADRGVTVALGNKDVGYELRCVSPSAYDRDYTRDLGVGAVTSLLAGVTGALITRQEGRIVPIPFVELMDPETGRTRVRMVDTGTDSFRASLALQRRVTPADLEDASRLEAIAKAARLSPDEARKRYTPLG